MGGKHSRNKGARSERALRDELIRHGWSDVIRVPLSGAVKTREQYQDDVVGRPPGWGTEIRFENKARATGFDSIYAIIDQNGGQICCALDSGECLNIALDPSLVIQTTTFLSLDHFPLQTQKVLKQVAKKCRDWIGNAQVLSLKQDRKPFIYVRYYR
jgi:hypothetical protein